jgi:hypothetical protein
MYSNIYMPNNVAIRKLSPTKYFQDYYVRIPAAMQGVFY